MRTIPEEINGHVERLTGDNGKLEMLKEILLIFITTTSPQMQATCLDMICKYYIFGGDENVSGN